MELRPRNHQQALLTIIGLIFLFLVIMLNHYHPRNQGVADITHGSVRSLVLGIGLVTPVEYSGGTLNSTISLPSSTNRNSQDAAQIVTAAKLVKDDEAPGSTEQPDCSQTPTEISKIPQKSDNKNASPDSAHQKLAAADC
jgi:hypothetical protein